MSDAPAAPARTVPWTTARVVRWLLAAQVLLAVLLAGGDFLRLAPSLFAPESRTPALERPVAPGDQTRRYAPNRLLPSRPALPGIGDLPTRLTWTDGEIGGAPGLALEGEIRPGDADRFLAHLATLAEPPASVTLLSPGGSVGDALVIGRALRAGGAQTVVEAGAFCLSACPYILAGGVERHVSRRAAIGVHQHFFEENVVLPAFIAVSDIQAGQAEVLDFLHEMGIDPMLMAKAMRTPPEDIYILLPDELDEHALATNLTD